MKQISLCHCEQELWVIIVGGGCLAYVFRHPLNGTHHSYSMKRVFPQQVSEVKEQLGRDVGAFVPIPGEKERTY